jgi:hypothetical protein
MFFNTLKQCNNIIYTQLFNIIFKLFDQSYVRHQLIKIIQQLPQKALIVLFIVFILA